MFPYFSCPLGLDFLFGVSFVVVVVVYLYWVVPVRTEQAINAMRRTLVSYISCVYLEEREGGKKMFPVAEKVGSPCPFLESQHPLRKKRM